MNTDRRVFLKWVGAAGCSALTGKEALTGVAAFFRFTKRIGAITNLDNQYPLGIWIGIDVATGIALAAGGFTTAALAHIFHRERY